MKKLNNVFFVIASILFLNFAHADELNNSQGFYTAAWDAQLNHFNLKKDYEGVTSAINYLTTIKKPDGMTYRLLGMLYSQPELSDGQVKQNLKKSFEYYKISASYYDPYSLYQLSCFYHDGSVVKKNKVIYDTMSDMSINFIKNINIANKGVKDREVEKILSLIMENFNKNFRKFLSLSDSEREKHINKESLLLEKFNSDIKVNSDHVFDGKNNFLKILSEAEKSL
jgi:TPR repeat protein